MRAKEYLTAIRADRGILTAHTMHFADEVRDPRTEIPALPATDAAAVSDRELAMAGQLIDMLAVDWNPDEYKDTFEEKVHELIAAKQADREVTTAAAAPKPSNVLDLMEVLSRSLESAKPAHGTKAAAPAEDKAEKKARPSTAAAAQGERPAGGRQAAVGRSAQRQPKETGGKKTTATSPAGRTRAATSATGKKTGAAAATARRREDLSKLTKTELYRRAADLDLAHRSTMNREELQAALEKAGRGRHLRPAS
ncbi:hypothetical protein [Kitasatospora sp. NPDC057223]|uniref:hypothetical protein n=1 Tax=Kitasatospora sp. NPDC057223 TaxID=3346055 RepID=UPI003632A4F4